MSEEIKIEIDKNCSYYKDIIKDEKKIEGIDCSWFKDCVYYKQLELLKAKYKNVLNLAKQNADSNEYCLQELEEQFDRLKQENEQIKKEYEKIQKVILANIPFKEIVLSGITPSNILSQIKEQNKKYKQALEKIKIISQNWTSKLMNDGYCEILDKINEVLNEK